MNDPRGNDELRSGGEVGSRPPPAGVRALDHTADVAVELNAPDFPTLLERAALGMDWLLRGEAPPPPPFETRELDLGDPARDPALALRELLRELLRWHERDGFAPVAVEVMMADTLRIRVSGAELEARPVREIKGVTLHGLAAEPREGGWWGRVVFDV